MKFCSKKTFRLQIKISGGGIDSFVGNTLYGFDPWTFVQLNQDFIDVTQLDQGAQTSEVMLNSIPEQFSTFNGEGCLNGKYLYFAKFRINLLDALQLSDFTWRFKLRRLKIMELFGQIVKLENGN